MWSRRLTATGIRPCSARMAAGSPRKTPRPLTKIQPTKTSHGRELIQPWMIAKHAPSEHKVLVCNTTQGPVTPIGIKRPKSTLSRGGTVHVPSLR
jgi:hypothetical protein